MTPHLPVYLAVTAIVFAVGLLVDYHAGYVLAVGIGIGLCLGRVQKWVERQ